MRDREGRRTPIPGYPLLQFDDGALVVFGMIACLILLSVAFLIDLVFSVAIFYAFPIALAAWLFGRWPGVGAAAVAVSATVGVGIFHDPARLAVIIPALGLITVISVGGSEWARRSEQLLDEIDERDARHRRMLETMTKVGQELLESKRWEVIAQHIADSLLRDLQLDVAWIFRKRGGEVADQLTLLAFSGEAPRERTINLAEGMLGRVARTGQPVQVESNASLSRTTPDPNPSPLEEGLEGRLILPVFVQGNVSAVLMLGCRSPRAWPIEEINIATTVASQLGLAMENASAYRSTVEALVRLEEVIQMKSDFLKTVSHELRTPMTVLAGYIDMIADGSLGDVPPDWIKPLNQVQAKVGELNKIVQSMLEASRAEGPSSTLNLEEIDLRTTLATAVAAQEVEAETQGHQLRHELPREPVLVRCDQDKILVVLRNLIENGMKYSPAGTPLDIGLQTEGNRATVWVADRGFGVPESERERIFDQFHRVERQDNRSISGTGLGLYIVKQLVEMHGGRIAVADRPGGGSVFAFNLPVQAATTDDLRRGRRADTLGLELAGVAAP